MKAPIPPAPTVALESWAQLLTAARVFRELAPWTWMTDSDVLAWQDPITGKVRIGTVIGGNREVFGVVVYRGKDGVRFMMKALTDDIDPYDLNTGLSQDALKLDFVAKRELESPDLDWLSQLGFAPPKRTRNAWPCFRSHLPSYCPWFLDPGEADLFLGDLRRMTAFARVLKQEPDLFAERELNELPFWPPSKPDHAPLTLNELEWHKLQMPPEEPVATFKLEATDAASLRGLPQKAKTRWELGASHTLAQISEPPRPYFAKIGLVVDAKTGLIVDQQLGDGKSTLEETAARSLVKAISTGRMRPEQVLVGAPNLHDALVELGQTLGIPISISDELPGLDDAIVAMQQFH